MSPAVDIHEGPTSTVTIAAHNDIPVEDFTWRLGCQTAQRLLDQMLAERFSGGDELVGLPRVRIFLIYQLSAYRIEVEIPIADTEQQAAADG